MSERDEFTPRLGRIGDRGAAAGKRYSARIRRSIAKLSKTSRPRFSGAQIGRGTAAGRAASFRTHPFAKFRMRRVVVKVHIARAAKGIGKAAFTAHVKYIQRDGVDRAGPDEESLGGDLYNEHSETLDDKDFLGRSEDDRHQFRIIVSPEDADQLASLKENTRSFMRQMETDLDTKLDWVAVDHYNTGHPHTHIVVRGVDERGKDLVIAREYLTKGLRRAASDIVTQELGPRRDMEIARARGSETRKDRLTSIDRRLGDLAKDNTITIAPTSGAYNRFERSLSLSRLKHLEELGLAAKETGNTWRLEKDWQETLKAIGKKGDVIRALSALEGGARDVNLFDAANESQPLILGRVLTSQAEDELRDTRALIVETLDGKTWHVPLPPNLNGAVPPKGAIIEANRKQPTQRTSDRTIADIAAVNGGIYSDAHHKEDDPSSSAQYRAAHVRRLEALRRARIVERFNNGEWGIPDDYLDRAAAFDVAQGGGVSVVVKSWIGLEDQIESLGPTWLDEAKTVDHAAHGFGKDAADAKARRQAHLLTEGLLNDDGVMRDDAKAAMTARVLNKAGADIAATSGKTFRATAKGERFEGIYERPVNLGSGRFAMMAKSKEFTLVPWRPELEKARGQTLAIKRTGKGISWTIGKSKDMGL